MAQRKPPRTVRLIQSEEPPSAGGWLGFVQLDPFPPAWKRLGLDDEALRALELAILGNPDGNPVVSGTGGIRKMRFAPPAWRTGKSGACRVYYAHFPEHGLVALVYAHSKGESEAISNEQARALRLLLDDIRQYLDRRRRGRGRESTQ